MKNHLVFLGCVVAALIIVFPAAALDTTRPSISITCPPTGQTYNAGTIAVSGTASDNVAVSKVEVRVGTGAWKTATGTAAWRISNLAIVKGQNTITARATDASGNISPISSIKATYAAKKVEIGNFGIGDWDAGGERDQYDSRLTFDVATAGLSKARAGVKTAWTSYSEPAPMVDFNWVHGRFKLASDNKGKGWTYGSFLLMEETWNPSQRAQWRPSTEGLKTWNIEGNDTFAGVNVLHLKPWYIKKYGSWNQKWWDGVKASKTGYENSIVMQWGAEYTAKLLEAWHIHMHDIGKKSAYIGPIGIPATGPSGMVQFETWSMPSPEWQYLTKNYDMIVAYQYPTCVSCAYTDVLHRPVSASVDVVKKLREKYGYKGKLVWILTSLWDDSMGTTDETIQFEEYKAVHPYVDIITVTHKADMTARPGKILNPPRLIKFSQNYVGSASPPPACTAPGIPKPTATPAPTRTPTAKPTPTPSSSAAAYWKFDGNALDSSGNNRHGTVHGGATYATGKSGTAIKLDGKNDYVSAPAISLKKSFTVLAWVNPSAKDNTGTIMANSARGRMTNGFRLFINGDRAIAFEVGDGKSGYTLKTGKGVAEVGAWQRVAFVYDGSTLKIYKNGVLVKSEKTSINFGRSSAITMGRMADGLYFKGAIDGVKLYNRALSASEVAADYK